VQVFSRERSDQPWRLVGRDTVYRLNKKEGELISPPIGVPLNSDRYWRLEFDQRGGGLGAGLPKLVLGWVPQEIAFAARGAPPYILTVGKWHTRQAALDISSLVPGYQRPVDARTPAPPNALLVLATLGPITVTRQLSDQPEDIKNKALQRAALWALLILGVGFIGWMAWRVLDQMRLTKLSVDSQTEELEP
jgi:hypothetical protein